MTSVTTKLYDVVAVSFDTNKVRILATNKTADNADATVNIAVMRRGIETEFFAAAEAGLYHDGDTWKGDGAS